MVFVGGERAQWAESGGGQWPARHHFHQIASRHRGSFLSADYPALITKPSKYSIPCWQTYGLSA
jgi:hypothetical protein